MAVAREHASVVASLSELRAIEEQRIADELAARRAAEHARLAAIAAAEEARREADLARQREAHAAQLRIEQARLDAEREARMALEAAQAAELARQQAALAEQRLVQELDLRRQEIAKQRPTWMVVVTALATLAAGALVWFAIERQRDVDAAQRERDASEARATTAKREMEEARAVLVKIEAEVAELDRRNDVLIAQLAKAQTAAEIREAKAAADREQAYQREVRERIRKQREAAEKAIRGQKVKIDEKCLTSSLC